MSATVPCAHCGLPAPRGPDERGPAFCCRGCRTVWELVHEAGLANYYDLRERLDEDADPGAARAEQAADEPAYAHLDDPELLARIGGQVTADSARADLHLVGLHCAACVWLIERLPAVLPGVRAARVDYGASRLQLEWDPGRVRLSQIAAFLHRAGYQLHALDGEAEDARRGERRRELIRIAVAGASAGNVMLVSFALYAGALSSMEAEWSRFFSLAALVLALPAVTYGALPFYRAAWAGLRVGRLHIDLPIALGVLAGFGASVVATVTGRGEVYFDSVSLLVFLLLLGRWVQRRGQAWALSRTDLLQLLVPARARVRDEDGQLGWRSAASLAPRTRVVVRAGERIPVDGELRRGRASVDASSLTGESLPIFVELGDAVLAGTVCVDGEIELEVEAAGAETRIGGLATRIMEADRSRAPIQQAVDRVSAWFVAAVLALALVGGLVWWSIDPSRVFPVVVSLLVISCPCALGLATPVALAVARARAAERGILFASAEALESLAKVERAVFDKTGTLTEGVLEVRAPSLADDSPSAAKLAAMVLAAEGHSGHPVAQALRRWASLELGPDPERALPTVVTAQDRPGRGREAVLDIAGQRRRLRIGSLGWIDRGARFSAPLDEALARGDTPVLVELDGRPVALLSLADKLRADAPAALERLRDLGLELAIRSGDHPRAVAALAARLGVEDFAGGLSPEDKVAEFEDPERPPAAMIGDGINDAPAMRAARVGVAVRGGAEIALRVADVHLARAGVREVAELVLGARRTLAVIHRNLGFSLVYNLVFASLALAGWIDPLLAAVLMPASSLTVVLSSALARSFARAPEPDPRSRSARRRASETRRETPLQSLPPRITVLRPKSP